jgi:hypothetical protein
VFAGSLVKCQIPVCVGWADAAFDVMPYPFSHLDKRAFTGVLWPLRLGELEVLLSDRLKAGHLDVREAPSSTTESPRSWALVLQPDRIEPPIIGRLSSSVTIEL